MKKIDEALLEFNKALDIEPNNVYLINGKGY